MTRLNDLAARLLHGRRGTYGYDFEINGLRFFGMRFSSKKKAVADLKIALRAGSRDDLMLEYVLTHYTRNKTRTEETNK